MDNFQNDYESALHHLLSVPKASDVSEANRRIYMVEKFLEKLRVGINHG